MRAGGGALVALALFLTLAAPGLGQDPPLDVLLDLPPPASPLGTATNLLTIPFARGSCPTGQFFDTANLQCTACPDVGL